MRQMTLYFDHMKGEVTLYTRLNEDEEWGFNIMYPFRYEGKVDISALLEINKLANLDYQIISSAISRNEIERMINNG